LRLLHVAEVPMPEEIRTDEIALASSDQALADSPPIEPPPIATPATTPPPSQDILCVLQELRTVFDDKIRFDAAREKLIERLHAELQDYKEDIFLKILKSMALDLITLHDNLGKWGSTGSATGSVTLADVQGDVEDVLDRNGFEAFVVSEEAFDPRRQRALRKVPTTDPSLDKHVAERLRKGFSYKGKVIRPECVSVYVLQPANPA
jgi:molecular chaperone GrpE